MSRAVLSLGSNLGDRLGHLRLAVDGLSAALVAVSPVYETRPWGGVEQGDFLNAVVIVEDQQVEASGWLRRGQHLERLAARLRSLRWGPRTLDIDVITVDQLRSDDPELMLPHPAAADRAFVLRPWLDIDPAAELPGRGAVAPLLAALPQDDLRRRDDLRLTAGSPR